MPNIKEASTYQEAFSLSRMYFDNDIAKGSVDADDHLYRRVTRGGSQTDIPETLHETSLLWGLSLYQSNAIGHRFIELINAFTVGEGPSVIAADESVQELLDKFWYDEHNNWPERVHGFSTDLSIYGEQPYFWSLFDGIDPILGMQYLNPADIEAVHADRADKFTMSKLVVKKDVIAGTTDSASSRTYDIVKADLGLPGRPLNGDIFYFKINNASDSTRGLSDLFPLADWIKLYDDYQFNMAERLGHLTMYFFDVVLHDASPDELRKFREDLLRRPPRPGSVIVHNDRAELTPKTVDLGGQELVDAGQNFFSLIATGAGWPAHWTGLPQSGNRANSEAANDPVLRHFVRRQSQLKRFLGTILRFQVIQAARLGHLSSEVDPRFKLVFPKLGLRDFQRSGGTAARVAQAIRDMVETKLIDTETGRKLIMVTFEKAGIMSDEITKGGTNESSKAVSSLLESIEGCIDDVMESDRYAESDKTKMQVVSDLYRLVNYHLCDL